MEEHGHARTVFVALLIVALVALPVSGVLMLPDPVASSFGTDGAPEGFMPRAGYLLLMTMLATLLPPLLVGGVGWQIRHAPGSLKMPNRAHWLAPERRAASAAWIGTHMMRFGSGLIVFMAFTQGLVLRANLRQPPHLELVPMLVGVGLFIAFTLLWVRALYARFAKPR